MDEKLTKFRREKAKQKLKQELKDKCKRGFYKTLEFGEFLFRMVFKEESPEDHLIEVDDDEDSQTDEQPCNYWKYLTLFIVWVSFYSFFIYLQFGAVYFCVTSLLFVYYNTRTGRRRQNEISAYSVFNKNCEQIDGTLTAEHFEKQIRSGML